jgi:glutamyl-tRNA reductase
MWSNLVVLHSDKKNRENLVYENLLGWKTCMRTVYIGDSRLLPRNFSAGTMYDRYDGYEAYSMLLKIISGLLSRLLGETEVLCQFKEQFKNENLPNTSIGQYMKTLRDELIEDTRKVRSQYLTNLGDQSYGGVAYRYLKNSKAITLIGSGQLANQMLPWLLKTGAKVNVVGRNITALAEIQKNFPVTVTPIDQYSPQDENIVLAAPMSVQKWVPQMNGSVIDFRENDEGDQFHSKCSYISFESILNSLKESYDRNALLRKQLEGVVEKMAEERELNHKINIVYCWEDIACVA